MKATPHYLGEAPVRVLERGVSGEDLKRSRQWGGERIAASRRKQASQRRGGVVKAVRTWQRKGGKKLLSSAESA